MFAKNKLVVAPMIAAALLAPAVRGQMHGDPSQMHGGAAPSTAPTSIAVPAGGISVPMLSAGGRPMIEVKINGKGPYRFILDTGASFTVIEEGLAKELDLHEASGIQGSVSGGGPMTKMVNVQEFRIGDAVVRGLKCAVMPEGTARIMLQKLMTEGPNAKEDPPRGVLSASLFLSNLVTFDFPAKRISIQKGKLDRADSQTIFDYFADDILPTIPVQVVGKKTRVHLDTGSGYGLTLPARFLKEVPLSSEPKEIGKARTHAGEFPISKAQVNGPIQVGKFTLVPADTLFSDVGPGFGEPIGQIGVKILNDFVVTLDPKNHRIRLAQ